MKMIERSPGRTSRVVEFPFIGNDAAMPQVIEEYDVTRLVLLISLHGRERQIIFSCRRSLDEDTALAQDTPDEAGAIEAP